MRDIKGAFQRTSEISREVSKTSGWLEDFAEQMYLKEQTTKTASLQKEARAVTAVEVARNQRTQSAPSVYEMMSAIVSGNKPKFSSVDEAVKHYQESTGLAQYLKAQEDDRMASYAALVSSIGDDDIGDVDAQPLPVGPESEASPVGPATNVGSPVGPATNSAEVMSADDEDSKPELNEKDQELVKWFEDISEKLEALPNHAIDTGRFYEAMDVFYKALKNPALKTPKLYSVIESILSFFDSSTDTSEVNVYEIMSADDKDEEDEDEDEEKEEKKSKKDDDDEDEEEDEEEEDEDDCGFDSLASVIRQFRLGIDGASKKKA